MDPKTQNQIIDEYEKEGNKIINQMISAVAFAQQKADSKKYKQTLGSIKNK